MRKSFLALAFLTGCVIRPPPTGDVSHVLLFPSDMTRPYVTLGEVAMPRDGDRLFTGCERPDSLKHIALRKFPTTDAIIGFTRWQSSGRWQCSGTAVEFEE
jgi:hypothetical protein